MTNEPDDSDVLEHSDLRPAGARQSSGARDIWRVIHRRGWRWSPFVVSLALLTALIVSVTPQGGALLRAIQTFGRAPTPVTVSSIRVDSPPGHVIAAPTTVLRTPPAPMLGQAPARCAATAPALTHVGPPQWGAAIGRAPVWLAGMSGAYPTLRLGREASANAYDWSAPYTQFGWPAPIGLTLKNGFNEPVRLTGWNINTGEAVSFGFV